METIGTRLRQQREKKNLTMNQVQELTGISKGNLSGMENDKNKPSVSALLSLSQILDCSIDWLLTGSTPVSKSEPESTKTEFSISELEKELLTMFRILSEEQQSDIYDFIYMKYRKIQGSKKGYTFSTFTNEKNKTPNDLAEKNDSISIA